MGKAEECKEYSFDFHYLDLVDAHNGNAWVSAEYGMTVYLPYPNGMTKEEAKSVDMKVLHYKGLHREYGISGQDKVEEAIAKCEIEEMTVEFTDNYIKFDVDRAGFSPFAIVWESKAYTITAKASEGGTISPSGSVTVTEGGDIEFTMSADSGYKISDVLLDGKSVGAVSSYKIENVDKDHTIEVRFVKISSPSDTPDPSKPNPPVKDEEDEPSNTAECQKEFSKDVIYSEELGACVYKFMIVDTKAK